MEQRLIDATKLQGEMMDMIASGLYGLEDMIDAVIEQPTVDAVPVVRCMECKYMRESVDGLFKSGYFCERCHITSDMENCDDFYCADGERKEQTDA